MSKKKQTNPENLSFVKFIAQKNTIIMLGVYTLLAWCAYFTISYFYPYPCANADTNNYLLSAVEKKFLGYRPYGFSQFLIIVRGFSDDIAFMHSAQFFLHYISSLFFILTVHYMSRSTNRWLLYLAGLAVLLAPIKLFLNNYLISDSLNSSLSLI